MKRYTCERMETKRTGRHVMKGEDLCDFGTRMMYIVGLDDGVSVGINAMLFALRNARFRS